MREEEGQINAQGSLQEGSLRKGEEEGVWGGGEDAWLGGWKMECVCNERRWRCGCVGDIV